MVSVTEVEGVHQKCTQRQIAGESEESAVPLFVGNIDLLEHQQCNYHDGGQAVVEQTGDGGNVEEGNVLVKKCCINHCRNTAEYSQMPHKMQNMVVFLAKQNCQCQHHTGHAAKAVGDDAVPSYSAIPENLRNPVGNNGRQQQKGKAFQNDCLCFFCFCALFGANQTCAGQNCGYDGEIKIIEDENHKLIWECPNCGNRDFHTMNIARRVCGYIGTNEVNQGRLQEYDKRVLHLT